MKSLICSCEILWTQNVTDQFVTFYSSVSFFQLLATLGSFNVQLVKNALVHHGNVMEIMTAETIQTKETVQLRKVWV